MQSKTFQLDGVGYDVFAGAHRVRVRQQVRMRILLDDKARRRIDDFGPRGGVKPLDAGGGTLAPKPTAVDERGSVRVKSGSNDE
jgi:hypothetical protein